MKSKRYASKRSESDVTPERSCGGSTFPKREDNKTSVFSTSPLPALDSRGKTPRLVPLAISRIFVCGRAG